MKKLFRSLIILLTTVILSSCGQNNLTTGLDLNPTTGEFKKKTNQFKPGESFSLLLKNVVFRDSYLDIVLINIQKDGVEKILKTIHLKGISTKMSTLKIVNRFAFPFPGKYKMEIKQLDKTLGSTIIRIRSEKQ